MSQEVKKTPDWTLAMLITSVQANLKKKIKEVLLCIKCGRATRVARQRNSLFAHLNSSAAYWKRDQSGG
jgi:hypothetical protein